MLACNCVVSTGVLLVCGGYKCAGRKCSGVYECMACGRTISVMKL